MGLCLICCEEAKFDETDGVRFIEGRDDVDCPKCGGYSIVDEYKHELEKALEAERKKAEAAARELLSMRVAARYRSGSARIVVEIDPASLAEMLQRPGKCNTNEKRKPNDER